MKIALFHPWLKSRGGAEKVVLEFIKNTNHEVDVYTWTYDEEKTFDDFKNFNIIVVAPRIVKKISRLNLLRGLFLFFSFFTIIPLNKYDVFLISTSGIGEFITFRNYKPGKTYAYIHTPLREASSKIIEWNLKNRYSGIKKYIYLLSIRIYRIFEIMAWRRLDYVIFNSELSKARAEERGLIKNKKTWIVHPPINIPEKIRTDNGNYLLYVSRINPPKRQKELIIAFKRISREFPDVKLIIVGSVDNKKYFDEIKEMGKGENIEIKVNISDEELNDLYNNCMAGIFLGYQEDFGIVPLEVVGRGKPLLAVDEGGYIDLIKDNPLFYKIKERFDSKAMADEIEKVLREFLIRRKFKRKRGRITFENFSEKIDEILEKNNSLRKN